MVRFTITALLTGLASLVATAPSSVVNRRQSSLSEPGKSYYLQTRVTSTQGNASAHNDLYLAGYHTGAGMNDVVLVRDVSLAVKGFQNDTYQEFDLGSPFPYGLTKSGSQIYVAW